MINNFLNYISYELTHIAHMIFSFGADWLTNLQAMNEIKFQQSAIYVCNSKLYVHIIRKRICLTYLYTFGRIVW